MNAERCAWGKWALVLMLATALAGCEGPSAWFGAGKDRDRAKEMVSLVRTVKDQGNRLAALEVRLAETEKALTAAQKKLKVQRESQEALATWTTESLLAQQKEIGRLAEGGVRTEVEAVIRDNERLRREETEKRAFDRYLAPFVEEAKLTETQRFQVETILRGCARRLARVRVNLGEEHPTAMADAVVQESTLCDDRLVQILSSTQLDSYRAFEKKTGPWSFDEK